ncbi:SCAN domain-containing protein 3-like [Aphis craccivora]|uniref:SCAN domain-containing protein 3-like n=1 Tax=Aphis craccivora TaxID=307492 RepID=A0A6G0VHB8_APHCR|nr:SCAN domain-containing protein 3-like [Aphis craccivora]
MYEIGTSEGRLPNLYSRNQFTICKESLIEVDNVPQSNITLREVARKLSNLGGQGYDRCSCLQKCKCKAAGRLCTSKCHGNNPCCNK